MVKTKTFIVCDKCEKDFKDSDIVYGYAKYMDQNILVYGSDNYTEYFFDEKCFSEIKKETIIRLRDYIIKMIESDNIKSFNFYISYINESFNIRYMDFDEMYAWYFYVSIDGHDQLIKIYKNVTDFEYQDICIINAINLMFKKVKNGRLDKLRKEFKEEYNRIFLASQTAHSYACSASDISIEGTITTARNY